MNLQTLLDDFMNRDDLGLLTRDIFELLECPVMVVDVSFHALSWQRPADFRDPAFQATIDRGILSYETSLTLVGGDAPGQSGARYVTPPDSPYRRRLSPLISGDVPVGYLILVDVAGGLDGVEPSVFSSIESALAKQMLIEANRGSQTRSAEEAVLLQLLEGRFADEGLFRLQAEAAGLSHFAPTRFALVNLELYLATSWSKDTLKNAILNIFPRSRPLLHDGQVLFFLNSAPDMMVFESLCRQYSLRIVLSAPLERLFRLPDIYRSTRQIMEYLLTRRAKPFAVRSEPYHGLLLLQALSPHGDLALPSVRALAQRDAEEQTEYLMTLYTYLCCHYSLQETCAALYTHRNTVLYRVKRMREDFAIPLNDPAQHLPLLLSCAMMLLEQGRDALFMPPEGDAAQA